MTGLAVLSALDQSTCPMRGIVTEINAVYHRKARHTITASCKVPFIKVGDKFLVEPGVIKMVVEVMEKGKDAQKLATITVLWVFSRIEKRVPSTKIE